ncbi:hypothetical protein PCASD_22133 [Puccinia coronata f. sp. avenae]|uniref:Uncharacterized protein n=1 Tax=Puccinia coronata f. sp. avenae TaxID=200324 RepID=A0A2N5TNS2_9BASI|nr:hypothetical protein PCASD_22133 [Puccinia coronata f. sp. avenae]
MTPGLHKARWWTLNLDGTLAQSSQVSTTSGINYLDGPIRVVLEFSCPSSARTSSAPARRSEELRHSDYDYDQWGSTGAWTPLACAPPNSPVMPSSRTQVRSAFTTTSMRPLGRFLSVPLMLTRLVLVPLMPSCSQKLPRGNYWI